MRDIRPKRGSALFILIVLLSFFLFRVSAGDAGVYLDSAHGDNNYGVNRSGTSGFPTDYPKGFCAHCHEQHASIGGSEPSPTGGPSDYLLFYANHTSQTDNFCFQCHTGSGSYQYNASSITNLLYSERAGKWNTSPDDILEAFSYSSPGTSHNLDNISTFINGKWSYTSDSNPCNACHNPHAAQGDPQGDGSGTTAAKAASLVNRGWPVSRPSLHNSNNDNSSWGLWGDGAGEKMSDYITANGGTYQAPYQYNTTSAYEPAACTSSCNGSDLTDFVTFCTDCHNDSNTIYSTTLGRNLYKFNWANEKHGGVAATDDGTFGGITINDLIAPYDESSQSGSPDYTLSCTDCHEPHGSANRFLVREGVNGGTSVTDVEKLASETPDNTKQWKSLCSKCHDTSTDNNKTVHHRAYNQEYPSTYMYCIYCHEPEPDDVRNCLKCHYHGSTQWPAVDDYGLPAHTYNSGEKMF